MDKKLNTHIEINYEKIQSSSYINYLYKKIKFYNKQIKIVQANKPLWFQKKKMIKYNKKILEFENIIYKAYLSIEKEIEQ